MGRTHAFVQLLRLSSLMSWLQYVDSSAQREWHREREARVAYSRTETCSRTDRSSTLFQLKWPCWKFLWSRAAFYILFQAVSRLQRIAIELWSIFSLKNVKCRCGYRSDEHNMEQKWHCQLRNIQMASISTYANTIIMFFFVSNFSN